MAIYNTSVKTLALSILLLLSLGLTAQAQTIDDIPEEYLTQASTDNAQDIEPESVSVDRPNLKQDTETEEDLPYGAQLFRGQFSADAAISLNPNYVIAPGDKINISLWGAVNATQTTVVDAQGNIFIPDVGPVKVAGTKLGDLNTKVRKQIRTVYTDGVQVYTNIGTAQPVSIFVTGNVVAPGRYSGVSTFTVFHYIDLAQGIDHERGSYRNIELIRDGETIETFDIYDFLNKGLRPTTQLKDGDTIFVKPQLKSAAAKGDVRNEYRFEFANDVILGEDMLALAIPSPSTTHASVSGTRDGVPFIDYLSLKDFKTTQIHDGDAVTFSNGETGDQLTITITGKHDGPQEMIVPYGTKLSEVLDYIPVDKDIVNIDAIQLQRKSVAAQQKKSLEESLNRLERKALSSTPLSQSAASQKAQEIAFISRFIERAKQVEPEGRVVVSGKDGLEDVLLEDNDNIIIPIRTSIVMVNGEVYNPKAVVYKSGKKAKYYINRAGGFSDFADEKGILIYKANGESIPYDETKVEAGDEVIVLPKLKLNALQVTKEVVDVIFKIATTAAVPIALFDD